MYFYCGPAFNKLTDRCSSGHKLGQSLLREQTQSNNNIAIEPQLLCRPFCPVYKYVLNQDICQLFLS